MKKKIWIGFCVAIVGILTGAFYFNSQKSRSSVYANLEKYSITDTSKLKGHYFLLHFWAKWCEPCAEEIPQLLEFAQKAQFPKPLYILAVSLDPSLEESKKILPENGANLPANFILALDQNHKYAEAVGSYQYPETYFVSPEGEILEKWVGPQKWTKPEVLQFFSKVIQR